jgi:anti-anti-sigma factor
VATHLKTLWRATVPSVTRRFGVLALHEESRFDGSVALQVRGVVDDDTVEEFERTIASALESEPADLVLDLTGCRLDSAGLAALVRMQRRLRSGGAFTKLVTTDVDLLRLLQIVGLMSGVRVYASLDAALHSARMDNRQLAGVGAG